MCLSEHGLFDEQKHLLETLSDQFVGKVICSDDNPDFMYDKRGHGDVAIFWKSSINDFVSPLDITSDRIVGIQFAPPDQDPLFVFSVYVPSSIECLDILWSLCEVYINKGPFIIVGDYNAHLGKLVGARGYGHANKRGEKLLEFLNYFNLVVLNLLNLTSGPLYTFMSENGKLKSAIDFIIVPSAFLSLKCSLMHSF